MRLLLDEMLSRAIAQRLREKGHDVEAVNGNPEHQQLSDPEVLDLARSQGRAVVTNNLVDFRPLHNEAIAPGGPGHHGIVFVPSNFRRTKADTGRIVAALEEKLEAFPGIRDLANAETWLTPG